MAQEMLQMVQSNPQIHGQMGIYNAYRRMYEAMGIQQVDQILPAPPQPALIEALRTDSVPAFLFLKKSANPSHASHYASHVGRLVVRHHRTAPSGVASVCM